MSGSTPVTQIVSRGIMMVLGLLQRSGKRIATRALNGSTAAALAERTDHGDAAWMTLPERLKRGLAAPYTPGDDTFPTPILGVSGGDSNIVGDFMETYPFDAHLCTIAPNRSGKGVGVIVPNLVKLDRSMVVVDPKGENAEMTAPWRENGLGQKVDILDPFGIVTNCPASRRGSYNPIDYLRKATNDKAARADMLAAALTPAEEGGKDRYFSDSARFLCAGLLSFLAFDDRLKDEDRHLGKLREFATGGPDVWANVCVDMTMSYDPLSQIEGYKALKRIKAENGDGVLSTLWSHIGFLNDEAIVDSLRRSDFDFADFRDTKSACYICLPGKLAETHAKWIRIILVCAFASIEDLGTVKRRADGSLPDSVLFLVDEFASLGHFDKMVEQLPRAAGFGIQYWFFLQNIEQLKVYGNGAGTILSNMGMLQNFGGSIGETAQFFSHHLGKRTMVTLGTGDNTGYSTNEKGGSSSAGESQSENLMGQALLEPYQITRLSGEQILIFPKHGVARIPLTPYFETMPWFAKWSKLHRLAERALPPPSEPTRRIIECPSCKQRLRVAARPGVVKCPNGHRFPWSPD